MASVDPFRGVAIFMQVVEAGSFTLAAERLEMTKSGVAKSIARLESSLGIRLFNRTTRRVSLTDEGVVYSEGCLKALSELEGVQAQLSSNLVRPSGKLRINLPVVLGRRWILPILMDIARRNPELEMDITLTDDRPVDLVEERYDLAIRIGLPQDSATLVAKSLGVQRAVLCAHPGYLARRGVPSTLADLHRHDCITFGSGAQRHPWHFLDRHGRTQSMDVRGTIALNNAEGIADAALDGRGIALLSDWLVIDALREQRLVEVLPDVPKQGYPIHALWQKNRHLTPKVRIVVDTLTDAFLPNAPWDGPA